MSTDSSFPPVPDEEMALAEKVVEYMLLVLGSPRHKDESLPEELRTVKNFERLSSLAWAIRKIALELGKGDLKFTSSEKGVVIGGLKAMQANLQHLTWQAKQIAGGDYSHKVDFLGEFSEAFNIMTEQLANRITRLLNTSEEYKDKSFRDPLTGMYNRMAFMHYAETILDRTEAGTLSCLLIADIDKFKYVNDYYGHLCGDEVLKVFATCLLDGIRPSDLCCRYGGEEFLILLPHTPLAKGLATAERLRSNVERLAITCAGANLSITASFGVSEISGKTADASFTDIITAAIGQADANLYRAKEAGRNQVIG